MGKDDSIFSNVKSDLAVHKVTLVASKVMYFTQKLYAILTLSCEILTEIKEASSQGYMYIGSYHQRMRMELTGDWEWDPEPPPLEVEVATDADI